MKKSKEDLQKERQELYDQLKADIVEELKSEMDDASDDDLDAAATKAADAALAKIQADIEEDEEDDEDDDKSVGLTPEQIAQIQTVVKGVMYDKDILPAQRKGGFGTPALHLHGRGVSEDFSVQRLVKFQITKDDSVLSAPERKAMSEGTTTAGGFLVPTEQSNQIIDLVRAQSVIDKMGSVQIPLNTDRLETPKLGTDVTGEWLGENAAATPSDLVIGQMVLTPKKLVTYTELSEELVMDSDPGVEQVLRDSIASVQALTFDLAAIRGATGGDNPVGISEITGISTFTLAADVGNGATPTYDDWTNIVGTIEALNGMGGCWLMAARTRGGVRRVKDDQNAPIMVDAKGDGEVPTILGRPVFVTNQIPTNVTKGTSTTNTSEIYFGIPDRAVIGRRSGIEISASREVAFKSFQVAIRSMSRVDFNLRTPALWCFTDGVLA